MSQIRMETDGIVKDPLKPYSIRLKDGQVDYLLPSSSGEQSTLDSILNSLMDRPDGISFGRGGKADIRIKGDKTVSRKHGLIYFDGSGNLVFKDLSSNGSLVQINSETIGSTSPTLIPHDFSEAQRSISIYFGKPVEGTKMPQYCLELILKQKHPDETIFFRRPTTY